MNRKLWTANEIEYLKIHYPNEKSTDVAKALGRTITSVYPMANNLGIKKTKEFLASEASGRLQHGANSGRAHRFKKGHTTWNKGVKMPDGWGGETKFKKGNLPHNTKTDGELSIRKCRGRPYIYKRIALGKWKELHRIIWEENNGPVPKGHNVQFKDKNSLNCVIENLYLIDRNKQMSENSITRFSPEVRSTIHLLSKVKRKIKDHEKQD